MTVCSIVARNAARRRLVSSPGEVRTPITETGLIQREIPKWPQVASVSRTCLVVGNDRRD